jgi:hypothetical protein
VKKKPRFQGKTRTREHIIADLAVNHVERQVLLHGFTMERIVHDYGLDVAVYTYNARGEAQEGAIYMQVKAAERVRLVRKGQAIAFRIERAHLQGWLTHFMPVILCVYDASTDRAYWLYVQQHYESLPGFSLFRVGETLTVHLPAAQVLAPAAIGQFANHLDSVRQQVHGRVRHV